MIDNTDLAHWEIMERWLERWQEDNGRAPFVCRDIASFFGIGNLEGTRLIQSYLHEQTRINSRTEFVIERRGRTRNAQWTVGVRKKDMQQVSQTYFDDVKVKAYRGLKPTLRRIAALNPQLAKEVEQVLDGALEGAFMVMKSALRV